MKGSLPDFLAMRLGAEASEHGNALTPRLMRWSDDVWVMDLSATRTYWEQRAANDQVEPLAWLRQVVQRLAPPRQDPSDADPCYAAAAAHPWQAVLLLSYMIERQLSGFVALESPLGRALYQQLSWTAWLDNAQRISTHLLACKTRRFHDADHRRQLRLMQAAVSRLKLERPWQLQAADPAIRRRFGATTALLWEWTYAEAQPGAAGFPWVTWSPPLQPTVERSLDFPIWQWDVLAPLLVEDFDRLCRLPSWHAGERVTLLTWTLTLHDLSCLEVPIAFRHPHALHRESGVHKTALAQANFAFVAAMQRATALQLRDDPPPLVAWTLRLVERLTVPVLLRDLFGQLDGPAETESAQLLELENQLPVALVTYDLCGDWLPEDSFVCSSELATPWSLEDSAKPWLMTARQRPLFFYQQPTPLVLEGLVSGRVFLERVAVKWWLSSTAAGCGTRDYYRLIDHRKRVQWVYQDAAGAWFVHGIFA